MGRTPAAGSLSSSTCSRRGRWRLPSIATTSRTYTYVLSGHIGAVLGDDEVVAGPGDLVFKPRQQWHTFWNAGDEPAAVLELISPAGLEKFFRWLGELTAPPAADELAEMAAPYHCDADPAATERIVERHGLAF